MDFSDTILSTSTLLCAAVPAKSPAIQFLITSLFVFCMAAWIVAGQKLQKGHPLVRWRSRNCVPWNIIDGGCAVFLAFAGLVFGQLTFVLVSGVGFGSLEDAQSLSARTQIQMILFMELGLVGAMLLTIGHMMFRAGATVSDLGFKTRHLGLDVRAGVGTFLLLAMPVLLLQGWLGKLFPEAGEHPLIELLRTDSALSTLLTFFCVVVVLAPIVEEFFFRVILQGWLERVGQGHISLRYRISSEGEETSQPALARTSPFEKLLNRDPVPQPDPMPLSHAWVSIVATSFLFALAHAGHGTAPIPLFIFSLGLGYVYQRTHTIWPSIVCHMLLNGFSFVQLVIDVTSKAHVAT